MNDERLSEIRERVALDMRIGNVSHDPERRALDEGNTLNERAWMLLDALAEIDELRAEVGRANERAVMWLQAATEASALLAHPSVAKHAAAAARKETR